MNNKGVHLYKLTHWISGGKWFVNDIQNLCGLSAKWFTPMRILELNVEEYIQLLLKYNAKGFHYYAPTDCLTFYFLTEKDAKTFCSYINKIAKQKNYRCA